MTALPILFLILFTLSSVLAQDSGSSTSGPDMAECGSHLLQLAPCAPFVQGSAASPVQSCCANLIGFYNQQPSCFCVLLNDTTMSSFPVNKTLVLQLPDLCNFQVNFSSCPGFTVPSSPPQSQVSRGTNSSNSSTVADSPTISLPPRSNNTVSGFVRNSGTKSKAGGDSVVLAATAFLLMEVLSYFSLEWSFD
ncbi:PREDICTED: protein YLS3 [Nelumbo nucifera]|uniref:Bifunctional inhibitor/plant lipid transfer protein/seed storage helical domain-containing protein n=2 Tax=Nelumbo nucifera TaxID=4432 RepID=A0A822YRD2_NELNU|nr:PREDICTED: protein YLS3 [Nelumbo nucifera]DAD31758.1 TPA_asm: hypothetical protein HUJ06_010609 [Nelumbo nucifera]